MFVIYVCFLYVRKVIFFFFNLSLSIAQKICVEMVGESNVKPGVQAEKTETWNLWETLVFSLADFGFVTALLCDLD